MQNLTKIIFIICLVFLSSFKIDGGLKEGKIEDLSKEQQIKEVFEEIDNLPFLYPEIVKKQVILESGHLTSDIAISNMNVTGMKHPSQRMSTSLGSKNGYAVYKDIKSCILDRLIFDASQMKGLSEKDYIDYLDRVYSDGGDDYSKVLAKINLKRYK